MKYTRHTTNRDNMTSWGKSFHSLLGLPGILVLSVLLTVPSNLLRADDEKLKAVDIQVETDENVPVDIDVVTPNVAANSDADDGKKGKGKDKGNDKDALFLHSFTQPANGTVTDNGDGTLTYTPSTGYDGVDDFEYTIRRGKEKKKDTGKDAENDPKHYATATVTVTVNQISVPNNPPVANAAAFSVDEDGALAGTLSASDVDGDDLTFALASGASNGSAAVAGDGSFTYAPNADYNGSDSFTFTVSDGSATSAPATVSINVSSVNDNPVITSATAVAAVEDEPFSYTATATDVDGDALTFTFAGLAAWASASGATVSGTPGEGDGNFSFTITANDNNGGSASQTVAVTITAVNDAPVANAAAFSVDEDGTLSGTLSGSDVDGDALSFALASGSSNGSASVSSNGSFTYTPNADYNGSDSFTFTVSDGSATSAPATVSITVNAVNDAPVAVDDAYTVPEDSEPVTLDVLANDFDVDGDDLTIRNVRQHNGIVHIQLNGTLTYEPTPNFSGVDEFFYSIDDGSGLDPVEATIRVTVSGSNDVPVADDASFSVDEDGALAGTLSGSDVDGDDLTFALASGSSNGSAAVASDGSFTYTPSADYNGSDSFTFTVNDGTVDSDPATVSFTVNAVNDNPVITSATTASGTEDEPFTYTATASDIDGDALTFTFTGLPAWVSFSGATVSGTPGEGDGNFSFTITADDNNGGSASQTVAVTIAAVNDVPVANAAAFSVDEDGTLAGNLTGSDAEGSVLTFAMTATGSNGTAVLNANGSFTYAPNANYNGSDSFTFTVSDGLATSAPATVSITVNAVNDAPLAHAAQFSVDEDGNLSGALTGEDIEGESLTFSLASGASSGTAAVNADGSFSYAPNAEYNGSDSFTFTVSDGLATSAPATVSITVNTVNDAPVADAAAFTVDEDGTLSGTLSGSDIDGDGLTFAMTATGSNGSAVVNTDGSFTYAPNEDYNGSDSFAFTVNDGSVSSAPATVSLSITPLNDNPVITSAATANAVEDEPFSYTATASDVDGDVVSFTFAGLPAWVSASGATVSGTPSEGDGGFSFKVIARDGEGGSDSLNVAVAVNPVNDAPVAAAAAFTLDEDGSLAETLSGNDVEGDALTFALADGAAHGEVTIEADGLFSYSPDGDYNGGDNFTFTVSDGQATSAPATVSLTINAVNDAPLAVVDTYNVSEDEVLTVSAADGVLSNDTDVENDALQGFLVSGPANGVFVWGGGDGSFVYTPNAGYNGTDSFTYYANDGQLNSATVTVTLIVDAINDQPVASGQSVSTGQDQAVNITLSASDPDGDPLLYAIVMPPAFGALSGIAPDLVYTPNTGFSGSDSFVFSVEDGLGGFATARVDIYVNVSDIIVSVEVDSSGGTVTLDSDGDGDLTPAFISIPGGALTEMVAIQISLYNDPPTTTDLAGPVFFFGPSGLQFASPVTITVPYDPALLPPGVTEDELAIIRYDEDAATWTALLPSVVDTINHTVSGQTDHFSGFAAGIPAGTNHAPTLVLALPAVSFDEDTSPAIAIQNLADHFADADLTDVLEFSAQALDDGLAGLFISNMNELVAIPQPDFFGVIRLLVTASDGSAAVSAEMLLTFNPVNDAPALAPIADVDWIEDSPIPIPLQANDVEGDDITFTATTDTSAVLHQILGDTTLLLIPLPDWTGNANITVTATDALGASDQQSFSVVFAARNDPPSDFALLQPADQTEILYSEDLMGQKLRFEWEGSSDADGEPVSYVFALEDENQTYLFRDTTDTSTEIPYSDIIAIMDDLGLGGITFWWSIWAVSGSDSVEAYNGPFELTITRPLAVKDNRHLPQMFALHQNFPNPFNPVTTLRYEMPAHTRVTLTIYDIRGRKVIRLVDGYMHAGYNRVIWNSADASGRPVPSGIYFARMVTPQFTRTIKMSLLK